MRINCNGFVRSAGYLFAITGVAKIMSALGNAKILTAYDPITSLEFRHLLLVVGFAELSISYICLFIRKDMLRTLLVAWLSTSFLVYRLGLWLIGWHRPCSCLGNLTDVLHIPSQTADTAMKIILAYLFIGSYATLFWLWRQKRKTPSSTSSAETTV